MILNNYMYITKYVVLTLHVTETIGQTCIVNVTYTFLRLNELFSLPQKKINYLQNISCTNYHYSCP